MMTANENATKIKESKEARETSPSQLDVYTAFIRDPEEIKRLHERCRGIYPEYPKRSAALFVHYTLWVTGMAVPYVRSPTELLEMLYSVGWQFLPPNANASPGDVYFLGIPGDLAVGCGIVVKGNAKGSHYFLGVNADCADGVSTRVEIEGNVTQYSVIHVMTMYGTGIGLRPG